MSRQHPLPLFFIAAMEYLEAHGKKIWSIAPCMWSAPKYAYLRGATEAAIRAAEDEAKKRNVARVRAMLRVGKSSRRRTMSTKEKNSFTSSSLLLLADIVGSGVLAIPGAFAKLGWVLGTMFLLICAPLNLYTGILLARIRRHHPNATTYGALAHDIFGEYGGYLGYGFLYVYIFLVLGEYQIVLAKSVQGVFYETRLCRPVAGIIASLIVTLSTQTRTMHKIAFLSIVSVVTIFLVLVICLDDIAKSSGDHEHDVVASVSFWDFFGAMSSFVFAWSGQKIYLEIMNEMKEPEDFPKSLYGAYPFILLGYIIVCCVTYGFLGRDAPGYLLDALDYDWKRSFASCMMFLHMQISYTLNMQVLARAVHRWWDPSAASTLSGSFAHVAKSRWQWFTITGIITFNAWLVSNLIPFFDDFVELVGALLSSPLAFIGPCILFLKLAQKTRLDVDPTERVIILAIVTFGLSLVIFGTIDALRNVVDNSETYGKPFDCFCETEECVVD